MVSGLTWDPTVSARVSVIVPAYNAADTIAETLEAILAQTHKPDEVIVADDGSSDETANIAEAMGCKVLRLENGGPGRARNLGAEASTGDVLFFCDADDTWRPDKIAMHLEAYRTSEPRPTFVFDLTHRVRPDGQMAGLAGVGRPGLVHWHELVDGSAWTCGSAPSIPSAYFKAVGGFLESLRFAEDVEVLIEVAKEFGPGYRINEVGTYYRLREGSLSRQPQDPHAVVRAFSERIGYLSPSQKQQIVTTVACVNALHAPPGRFWAALAPIGLDALKEKRTYRYLALRTLHFLGLRPL